MNGQQFLELLYPEVEADDYLLLWEPKAKKSIWLKPDQFATIDQIIQQIPNDLYFGVGLRPDPAGFGDTAKGVQYKRGGANDITTIPGFFADIDVANETAHGKTNLPPTELKALSLATNIGLKPSLVVYSGYGLHVYWLFKEPWRFDTPAERDHARDLNHKLQCAIRRKAEQYKWTIDATFNLDRILRLPGTLNCKNGQPREVTAKGPKDPPRYNPQDFEELLIDIEVDQPKASCTTDFGKEATGLYLDRNAEVPSEKFANLWQMHAPDFERTWNKDRDQEFKNRHPNDDSPSAYDFALAIMAVQGGWSNEEIFSLIIAFRRKHNFKSGLKLDNKQYYLRTVKNARERVEKEMAERDLDEARTLAAMGDETPESVEQMKRGLSQKFWGARPLQFIKYEGDQPTYRLITDKGSVMLTSTELLDSNKFRRAFYDQTTLLIPRYKAEKWDPIVRDLTQSLMETQYVSEDAEIETRVPKWIKEYLDIKKFDENVDEAVAIKAPFIKDEHCFFFFDAFYRWCQTNKGYRSSQTKLQTELKVVGVTTKKINCYVDGKRTTRTCWRLPEGMQDEILAVKKDGES